MSNLTRDKAEKHSSTKKQLIVILEGAFLETMKGKKGHELLNCDDHITFMKKMKKDFSEARPDITHQVFNYFYLFIYDPDPIEKINSINARYLHLHLYTT
jgi:rRNA pseudouridine-1189 N-methylase Emg1 (Nep1/Mra1 family)